MTRHCNDQTEMDAATQAVRAAAKACQAVQDRLISAQTIEKKDKSPVTVADFASQAVVCSVLEKTFPDDAIVGEEDAKELRDQANTAVRKAVVEQVALALDDSVTEAQTLGWIDRGGAPATSQRYWTLDPIDGTKGFLRREQYAIALALIENGRVVLGVLGCPNLNFDSTGHTQGALFTASTSAHAEVRPLWDASQPSKTILANNVIDPSQGCFCESVESGHSDQSSSARIAQLLGVTRQPYRIDSQCKYACVARGDASIYLRLPTRADYEEKIWDHAAGKLIVEQAGATVSDITGAPLDFSQGRTLKKNKGVVAAGTAIHAQVVRAVQQVLG